MQTSDFSTGKFFVLLKDPNDVSAFTDNPVQGTNQYRAAADASGVLVFLENICQIYTHGQYYSIKSTDWSTYVTKVDALDTSVNTLIGTYATLNAQVQTNTGNIGNLPVIDNTDPQNPVVTTPGSGLLNDVNDLITDVNLLKAQVSALDPNGSSSDFANAVNAIVDAKLATALQSYVDVTTYNADLATLATKSEFNTFTTSTVSRLNTLEASDATNTAAIATLQNQVTAIPKFGIEIVSDLPNLHIIENNQETNEWNIKSSTNPDGISLTTIYLKKRTSDAESASQEMFTEYICVEDEENGDTVYRWEKLGSQFFTISNYYTISDANAAIQTAINNAVGAALNDPDIAADSNWYSTLKGSITELQNLLTDLDTNNQRVLAITGEDIKTHPSGNTTVAQDIDSLQNRLSWEIINSQSQQSEP